MSRSDLPIIDAHQHFWDLERNYLPWLRDEPPIPFRYGDYSALKRNYMPDDYREDSRGFRIVGTVFVETEWNPADPVGETRWVHGIARQHRLPSVMVCHARLDRDDIEAVLEAQCAFPLVRSLRHKPRAAPSPDRVERGAPGSLLCPVWRRGFALLERHGLSFDLQTPWWHLYEAAELFEAHPGIPVILNHTGLPADRSPEGLAGWRRAMARLAAVPHVAVKISGLGVPGQPWTVAANERIVLDTIELFGAGRCMFASNFPVDGLVASFATIFDGFLEITSRFPAADRHRLFADNARRIYGIPAGGEETRT